jgi:hypothetical protein
MVLNIGTIAFINFCICNYPSRLAICLVVSDRNRYCVAKLEVYRTFQTENKCDRLAVLTRIHLNGERQKKIATVFNIFRLEGTNT